MKIFLVRHGSSVNDNNGRWQHPDSLLSHRGKLQAEALSKRPRFQVVDLVMSSEWPRARKTADIVAGRLKKPLKLVKEIHERKQFSGIYNAKRTSKVSRQYCQDSFKNYRNLDWKFSDEEESIREVIKRAVYFRDCLTKKHLKQNVLVVSHDVFIRCLLIVCLLGQDFSDQVFLKLFYALRTTNTGISLLEYKQEYKKWTMRYFNDLSHLGLIKKE